jgi:hypothetical protein
MGMRWWTLPELEATEARVYPERLVELLREALGLV